MGCLNGKIAVITGGTTGIGEAAARLFKAEGATVIVMGSNPDNLVRARATFGVEAIACDVGSIDSITRAMKQVQAGHGRIDILFANAGIPGAPKSIDELDEATFDLVIGINLKGMLFTVQKALPMMGNGSAIVLTSSIGAHDAMPMNLPYSASKAGVRALGRGLAGALHARGIRVNVLTPGLFRTPLFGKMAERGEKLLTALAQNVPMGRPGDPGEAAAAALFLASPAASFITGAELKVSGGQTDL
jgi:NAD(P)-dependent dehydrogenase (short-subunit alcohol dehydrogenase family)